MAPRLFLAQPFAPGAVVSLPAPAARHVQVLRLQPGDALTLFNGSDGAEWPGEIVRIGRREVEVRLGSARAVERELACAVTIALGVPANDRMDALVEKAGELGAAAIQPLVCERSVLRLSGERAEARRVHWQAVAAAASEQCGRARVTAVLPLCALASWLGEDRRGPERRLVVLSLAPSALAPAQLFGADGGAAPCRQALVLSGPEGGLSAAEEAAAIDAGFTPVGLGPRTLRADTAPLALLAWLALGAAASPAAGAGTGDTRRGGERQ
jgi:16S rRNA (uracil1498-N3)-methyltransferase